MKPKTHWGRLRGWFWPLVIVPLAHGATLQTPYSFPAGPAHPYARLVKGGDGYFYGTTSSGGLHGGNSGGFGAVFKVTTNGTLTSLASFNGTDGANPQAGLIQGSDGNFYGATQNGGVGYGTVFRVATNGVLTSLYSFTDGGLGGYPLGDFVQGSDGNFYGTRLGGGSSGYGTVFTVTTNGTLATLASFAYTNGAYPDAGLVQGADGNFYGTTQQGGTNGGFGTVFQLATNGTLTCLVSFDNNNGATPQAVLVQGSDGSFYGTTVGGGTNGGYGTVFMVTTNGGFASLYSFTGGNDGAFPRAGLVQGTDGNFYGTTSDGGTNGKGTVFVVATNGVLTSLYSFSGGSDGANPYGGLVEGSDGNFYGTTVNGGNSGDGTVFMVTTNGTLTSLASFTLNPNGSNPYGGLTQGGDNNFYGTTVYSGRNGNGTVFKVTTNGMLATLVSFNNTNGAHPYAGLVQGRDSSFYGTTANGGSNGQGTVFVVTTNGMLTSLYSFTGGSDGANPYAGLVQATDGNFYGTTVNGGTGGGTVFMIQTNGVLTTLASFANTNGAFPYAGLIQSGDGNFYGTTTGGGTNGGGGTVFMVTTNGTLGTLFSFSAFFSLPLGRYIYPDGGAPYGGLVQGSDGSFYGTTAIAYGTVFKVTTNGTLTTVYRFGSSNVWNATSLDGTQPFGGLVQGSDGNLYGTTYAGGPLYQGGPLYSPYGTVFRIASNGTSPNLVSFADSNGANPYAGLVQGSDSNLYGTTYRGGANANSQDSGYGTVFRVILPPTVFSQPTNQTVPEGGVATFTVGATGFAPLTYQWRKNAANIAGATNTSLSLSDVAVTSAANYSVAVSNPGGTVFSSSAALTVTCPAITVNPATLPVATVGQAYGQTNTASGGIGPYTFARTSGLLPPGLVFLSSGALSGTPSKSGNYIFIIRATDFYGCIGTNLYTLTVNCPTITLGPLPAATVGTPYNETNIASGGTTPYTFALTGGSLPPGFVLSTNGLLSGTATNAGNYSFTCKATDAHGCTGTNSYNLSVNCPAISVGPATLPLPRIGTAYSQTNSASGGGAPYTFVVTVGSLPPGFVLSTSGVLSGTPTNLGDYSFTVMATDVYGCTGNQSYALSVGILLVNPFVDSNGWFRAQVVGPTGSTFVVIASSDLAQPLSNWTSLTTNSAPNGIFDFTDTNNVGFTNIWPQRFYRAWLWP